MSEVVMSSAWWFFVALTVLPAIYILMTKNVMRAAFALLATFLGLAGLYVFLQAYFIAVTQIMVYVGGILVLMIFGIMLSTGKGETFRVLTGERSKLLGLIVFGSILYGGYFLVRKVEWPTNTPAYTDEGEVMSLGFGLMTQYVLPFEVVGIILLIALIAAVYISKDLKHE